MYIQINCLGHSCNHKVTYSTIKYRSVDMQVVLIDQNKPIFNSVIQLSILSFKVFMVRT